VGESEPGVPRGMKFDTADNVFCGGAGGIYIHDPKGKKLVRIVHGLQNASNIAFCNDDWKTVYFCTCRSLGSPG
jgi:sugar lactone lactonase YvrE